MDSEGGARSGAPGATPLHAPMVLLRRAWLDIAAEIVPGHQALVEHVEARLEALEREGRVAEASLLMITEDAAQLSADAASPSAARTLSKRMRRAVYEFLLALDAMSAVEYDPNAAAAPTARVVPAGATLIGLEEVAAATNGHGGTAPEIAPQDGGGDDAVTVELAREGEAERPGLVWDDTADTAAATLEEREPEAAGGVVVPFPAPGTVEPGVSVSPDLPSADSAGDDRQSAGTPADHPTDHAPDQGDSVGSAEEADMSGWPAVGLEPDAEVTPAALHDPWAEPPGAAVFSVVTEDHAPDPPAPDAESPLLEAAAAELTVPPPAVPDAAPVSGELDWGEAEPASPAAEGGDTTAEGVTAPPPAADLHVVEPHVTTPAPVPDAQPWPVGPPATAPGPSTPPPSPTTPPPSPTTAIPAARAEDAPAATRKPREDHELRRVPETFRRADPAGTPVVPSYRAWADVLAGASDQASAASRPGRPSAGPPSPPPTAPPPAPARPAAPPPPPRPASPAPPPMTWHASVPEAAPTPAPAQAPPQLPAPPQPPATLAPDAAAPAPDAAASAPDATAPPRSPGAGWPAATSPGATAPAPPPPPSRADAFHLTDPNAILPRADGFGGGAAPDADSDPWAPQGHTPSSAGWPSSSRHGPVSRPTIPDPAAEERSAAEAQAASSWSVRQSPRQQLLAERMAQKRREEAVRAAAEAIAIPEETGRKRRRGQDQNRRINRDGVRAEVDELLRRKKGADTASLLQRAAQEMGGREIADLAIDCGDRCRSLGQSRAAINCYLAAWRAEPLYETPLWRLVDVCINDRHPDLAAGYMERIADLMRARGDDEGALGVYRRIVAIVPDRADIRDRIRAAQVTGRLFD